MTTLIDRLRGLLIHFGGDNNIRTMNDAIEAVAERDKLHADIETLRLDLDTGKQVEYERTRLAIKCDKLQAELDAARKAHDTLPGATYWAGLAEVVKQRDDLAAQVEHYRGETRQAKCGLDNKRDAWRQQVQAQTAHADEMRLAAARAMTERDEARKQWENNAAALVSVHKELKAAKDRVREQEFAIACRSAARVDTAEPGTDTTVIWKQAPPSPLNLVERVLRLERAVLFVRQRPDTRNDIKARRP